MASAPTLLHGAMGCLRSAPTLLLLLQLVAGVAAPTRPANASLPVVLPVDDEGGGAREMARNKRQFTYQWVGGLIPIDPCFTSTGDLGRCTSFRQCYPYFKLPDLSNWETWVLGMYDTCSYFTRSRRQMFGVCCTNPVALRPTKPSPPEHPTRRPPLYPAPANKEPLRPAPAHGNIPPNWPPPIPTHPPDHTIPPLPTHPPSPAWPGQPAPTKPTTQATTPKPKPTPPTPAWPPPIPTHPPSPAWPGQPVPTEPPTYPPETPTTPVPAWPPPIPTHPPSPAWPAWPGQPAPTKPTTPKPKPPTAPSPVWPPPLPTHPPIIQPWPPTHPPLPWPPTHPPHPWPPIHPPQPWPPTRPPPQPSPPTQPPQPWPPTHPPYPTHPTQPPTVEPTQPEPPSGPVDMSCGAKNGYQDQERIVGGQNADLSEWPWIAALFNSGRQFCGGSLIDNIHILTAAHCVAHMSAWDVARLTVRLGDYNIKSNAEIRHIEKKVKKVVRHRGFDSRTLYNDIAILTMDSPVAFSKQVRSICLPSGGQSRLYDGQTATVIGWGSLRESGPQPAILQEVNIPVWKNHECRNKYGPAAPGGIVETFLCAGQASRDSCSGDSGGPLMVNEGRWTQVGIVSWGIGCGKGQYPGVYTRITHYMGWIQKNLK